MPTVRLQVQQIFLSISVQKEKIPIKVACNKDLLIWAQARSLIEQQHLLLASGRNPKGASSTS